MKLLVAATSNVYPSGGRVWFPNDNRTQAPRRGVRRSQQARPAVGPGQPDWRHFVYFLTSPGPRVRRVGSTRQPVGGRRWSCGRVSGLMTGRSNSLRYHAATLAPFDRREFGGRMLTPDLLSLMRPRMVRCPRPPLLGQAGSHEGRSVNNSPHGPAMDERSMPSYLAGGRAR
jgi:hypothetical protein